MATKVRRERPVRTLVTLGVLVSTLFGGLLAASHWSDATLTPNLALDLEGGTQIILTPVTEDQSLITDQTISQAIEIIRQRVDASGVAEAEITSQGGSNIVVGLPGQPSETTLDLVRESAQMLFRPVIAVTGPEPLETADDVPEDQEALEGEELLDGLDEGAGTADAALEGTTDDGAAEGDAVEPEAGTDEATTEPEATEDPATEDATDDPATEPVEPQDPSDPAWLTDELFDELVARDCTAAENLRGGAALVGDLNAAVIACDANGLAKYVLGPVEIHGQNVAGATSGLGVGPTGVVTNQWVVNIDLDSEGTAIFRDVTTRLLSLESPRNQFAMVLDGLVIIAPQINNVITDGNAEISGSFNRETAGTLARQLNFGALPLTFEVQSEQQISATLGSEQLERGLLAGLIGLALVAVYSLIQYRALGMVTITSLISAGVIAYGMITFLSWAQGYRLSLPGVAGLIVAIGITADSFIVYFERIRDELRDGRSLVAAIDQAWSRARRTILISDAVSLIAAVVLYFLAVGGVRGFAFTLGLTTVVDLIVVFFFTHPVMKLLARTRFFAQGHRLSGLDPSVLRGGSRYVGRGRVAAPGERADRVPDPDAARTPATPPPSPSVHVDPPEGRLSGGRERTSVAAGAASGRMTIAERRAAERKATSSSPVPEAAPEGPGASADEPDVTTDGKDA